MTAANWADGDARALAIYLDGADAPDRAADGSALTDDDFLVLVSAWWEPLAFTIPAVREGQTWQAEIDSYDPARPATAAVLNTGDQLTVSPRSIVVLRGPRR
jgi:glycogen operon protein